MRRFALVAVLAGLSGCGGEPEDRTADLVACFQRAGGTVVERPAQLAGFPTADADYGTGFSLESIAFDSIDASTGRGDEWQALVLINRPQIPQPASNRAIPAAEFVRRAQRGERVAAQQLIVMPPFAGQDDPMNDCAEEVARDQIFP